MTYAWPDGRPGESAPTDGRQFLATANDPLGIGQPVFVLAWKQNATDDYFRVTDEDFHLVTKIIKWWPLPADAGTTHFVTE